MSKLRILLSETTDPWFNLATEDWIFRDLDPNVQTLFLWRNQHTVVIGRNQNPWTECDLAKMEDDGVKLARRTSGGGAVYHDLGNTCFTFLSPREGYDRSVNSNLILTTLQNSFGIEARASGRNDLIIDSNEGPKKFSGSAFRESRDRAFHHGTVLMSVDLTKLAQYLTPHPKKMMSKGRSSVRARVMNLSELSPDIRHETFVPALVKTFCDFYDFHAEVETLNPESLIELPGLQKRFDENASWSWRFGHAPQFQQQLTEYLSWGLVDVFLDTDQARLSRVEIYSDSLFPSLIEGLQTAMRGIPYSKQGFRDACASARRLTAEYAREILEFENWIVGQIEV